MKLIHFFLLYFITISCWADVFKSLDSDGNVTYSDSPMNTSSQRIPVPQEETFSPGDAHSNQASKGETSSNEQTNLVTKAEEKKPYTKFLILTPTNQATIQNQPVIDVIIDIDPPIQKGDTIQIYLDGKPWGAPSSSTRFQFTQPDRGTHSITAKLFNERNSLLRDTEPHTVYIHQAHIATAKP